MNIRIRLAQSQKLFQERCILRTMVRVKEVNVMWQLLVGSCLHDAHEWRNADAASKHDRRFLSILMQKERPIRPIPRQFAAALNDALEGRAANAGCELKLWLMR